MPAHRSRHAPLLSPSPYPRPGQLRTLYDEVLGLPNVQGCYLGFKRRGGRTRRTLSLVVCVSEKIARRKLRRTACVPATLGWQATSRHSCTLPTDVRIIGGSSLHTAVLGAGDGIEALGPPGGGTRAVEGTIGAAMVHPVFGKVATTAGHVLGLQSATTVTFPAGQEPRVTLRNGAGAVVFQGIARKASVTAEADYALISPPPGMSVENLYQDQQPLALPLAPVPADLGKPVFVLARKQVLPTRLEGIHGTLTIGSLPLRDLLFTGIRTIGGDSGACLVDADSRLLGFVEGVTQLDGRLVTAYTSAAWPFVHEGGVFF